MASTDDELREAASHRGLKLVKSRKRKPGVGDYGLFGLTDAAGKPLFGMGDDGLTATPDQIIDFLRKGEVSTWAASAESVPNRPKPAKTNTQIPDDEEVSSAIRPRKRRKSASVSKARVEARTDKGGGCGGGKRTDRTAPTRKMEKRPAPEAEPVPEPELSVRKARPQDAEPLHHLLLPLGEDLGAAVLKRAISSAISRKEPMLVAEKGELIGCLAWHAIPDPLRGDTARMTMIFVGEDMRRQGIGRALYEAALTEIEKRRISRVEAMSEIEVRNANGFYRAMGLKQTSYQFVGNL